MKKNNYWKLVVNDIEKSASIRAQKAEIRDYDFSRTLPEKLRKRVGNIMPYEFDDYDEHVFMDDGSVISLQNSFDGEGGDEQEDSDQSSAQEKKKKKHETEFNESTCSEIEHLEHEFPKFDLKINVPEEHKNKSNRSVNWCSEFICKPRKERIKWDSKIYQLETKMWEKTLDEQAEILMEASAERFTEWVNSLGNDYETNISKDKLKALFSIEGDRKLLSSIQTEPKEVKAIAKTVADKWNLPEMAIELKYENYIKNRLKKVPKKVHTVSFGRTIPYPERPWVPKNGDDRIKTVFPKEILTGQKLFKGIQHLRSTKALIEFYNKHPNVEKPRFLSTGGLFKAKKQSVAKLDVPLYEKLKLVY